jgi:hypothetical protein
LLLVPETEFAGKRIKEAMVFFTTQSRIQENSSPLFLLSLNYLVYIKTPQVLSEKE